MSLTPETVTCRRKKAFAYVLVGFGIFFALATLGNFNNGGNVFIPALLSGVSFFAASRVKFKWVKNAEVSTYK